MKTTTIRPFVIAFLSALMALCFLILPALAEVDSIEYIKHSWSGTGVLSETMTSTNVPEFPLDTSVAAGTYVVNKDITISGRVSLAGDTDLILMDGCTLNVKGLYVPLGKTLKIYGQTEGTGKLVSYSSGGAGIGAGNIEIHGGSIDAKGDKNGAGIGSYDTDQSSGTITIYAGSVKATGGESGAGIGAGSGAVQGRIIIYGGTVTAKGGHYAAGIGGGNGQGKSPMKGGHAGTIDIYGGNITAIGGDDGAGIGGGEGGNCGKITIYGGTIEKAKGGNNSAGIGGGECESTGDGGTILILGGTVNAYGGGDGAGIGGGDDGHVDKIEIKGGKVMAYGGERGAGIGGGHEERSNEIEISGGEIWAYGRSGAGIGGGQWGNGGRITISGGDIHAYGGGSEHCGDSNGAGIGGGGADGDGGIITISGGTVVAESKWGAGIGGGRARANGTCNTGDGAKLTITGGKVTAKAYYFGIGTGAETTGNELKLLTDKINTAGTLSVSGNAEVEARGFVAGFGGDSGTLIVNGGELNLICDAESPYQPGNWTNTPNHKGYAGLWLMSDNDGRVSVNGGKLNVTGGYYGGILLGGNGSHMEIGGGEVNVKTLYGPGIGNKGNGPRVEIYGGSVYIYSKDYEQRPIGGAKGKEAGVLLLGNDMKVGVNNYHKELDDIVYTVTDIENWDRERAIQNNNIHVWIKPCDHNSISGYTVTESGHTKICKLCYSTSIPEESHEGHYEEGICSICQYQYGGTPLKISFQSGGASGYMADVKLLPGTSYSLPKCTYKAPDKKVFDKWSVKIGGADPVSMGENESLMVNDNIEVTAIWKNLYTVNFSSDDGSKIEPQYVAHGDKAQWPGYPEWQNHAMKGWKLFGAAEDDFYDFDTPVTKDLELVAVWTDQSYVAIDAIGTNNLCTAMIGYPDVQPTGKAVPGTKVTLSVTTPEYYTFEGWYPVKSVSADGRVMEYDNTAQLSSELSFVYTIPDGQNTEERIQIAAVFRIEERYSSSFEVVVDSEMENGSVTLPSEYYSPRYDCYFPKVDFSIPLTINPASGWWPDTVYYTYKKSDSEGETLRNIDPDEGGNYSLVMPAHDIILHATFDKNLYSLAAYTTDTECSGPVGTVSIDPDKPEGYKVHESVTVTVAEKPIGYEFVGWYPVTGVEDGKVTAYDAESLLSDQPSYTSDFGKENRQITAVYRLVDEHTLSAYTTNAARLGPVGTVAIEPERADNKYKIHETVTLTVNPDNGNEFLGWYPVTSITNGRVTGYEADNQLWNKTTYSFEFGKDDLSIAAVFRNENKLVTVIPANGAEYTAEIAEKLRPGKATSEIYDHSQIFEVPVGSYLEISALDRESVLRWEDESHETLGSGENFWQFVENDVTVWLLYKEVSVIAFDAGVEDAAGMMEQKTVLTGSEYTLPECGYTAAGKKFDSWSVRIGDEETVLLKPGDKITVSAEVLITANWKTLYSVMPTAYISLGGNTIDLSDYVIPRDAANEIRFAFADDMKGCTLNGSMLTSGNQSGEVAVTAIAEEDGHYAAADPDARTITASVTEKTNEMLAVFQNGITYGSVLPDPDLKWRPSGLEGTILYSGIMWDGSVYGETEVKPSQVGSYTVTVLYESSDTIYYGSVDFRIDPLSIAQAEVTLDQTEFVYSGSEQSVSVTEVKLGAHTLAAEDYTVHGTSGKDAGEYTVTVTGRGNYKDEATAAFVISDPVVFGPATFILPADLKKIDANAFESAGMSVVDVPGSCDLIGAYAFMDCESLTQIRIPGTCKIGEKAFSGCRKVYIFSTAQNDSARDYCSANHNCVFVVEPADENQE